MRWDLTVDTKVVLELLQSLLSQKNGKGATLGQVSELWRWSKSKTVTKFLNTDKIVGYGKGSGYKKADWDRILHAMVFEGVIQEISEETGSGFNADYLQREFYASSKLLILKWNDCNLLERHFLFTCKHTIRHFCILFIPRTTSLICTDFFLF